MHACPLWEVMSIVNQVIETKNWHFKKYFVSCLGEWINSDRVDLA